MIQTLFGKDTADLIKSAAQVRKEREYSTSSTWNHSYCISVTLFLFSFLFYSLSSTSQSSFYSSTCNHNYCRSVFCRITIPNNKYQFRWLCCHHHRVHWCLHFGSILLVPRRNESAWCPARLLQYSGHHHLIWSEYGENLNLHFFLLSLFSFLVFSSLRVLSQLPL